MAISSLIAALLEQGYVQNYQRIATLLFEKDVLWVFKRQCDFMANTKSEQPI
jgi:hypothetical protein